MCRHFRSHHPGAKAPSWGKPIMPTDPILIAGGSAASFTVPPVSAHGAAHPPVPLSYDEATYSFFNLDLLSCTSAHTAPASPIEAIPLSDQFTDGLDVYKPCSFEPYPAFPFSSSTEEGNGFPSLDSFSVPSLEDVPLGSAFDLDIFGYEELLSSSNGYDSYHRNFGPLLHPPFRLVDLGSFQSTPSF